MPAHFTHRTLTVAMACALCAPAVRAVPAGDSCVPFPGAATIVGSYLNAADVADVDGDGRPDILALEYAAAVRVLLAAGDGTFDFVGEQPLAATGEQAVAADVNGDGATDVCAVHAKGVATLLGSGGGALEPAIELPLPTKWGHLAVGDLDGDGHADLLMADNGPPALAHVLIGQGDGSFVPAATLPPLQGANDAVLADLDADGHLDVVISSSYPAAGLQVALGLDGGAFAPLATTSLGVNLWDVEAADMDLDGHPDLVVGEINASVFGPCLFVMHGAGDGSFVMLGSFPAGPQPSIVDVGDVDADGWPDVAVGNGFLGGAVVVAGLGGGSLGPPLALPVPYYTYQVSLGDFTDDGFTDVLVVDRHHAVVRPGLGDGSFVIPSTAELPPLAQITAVGLLDLDGDAQLDAVAAEMNGLVWIAPGDGAGALGAAASYPTGSDASALAVGDVNVDGRNDVVTCSRDSDQVWVLAGLAGGGLAPGVPFPTGAGPDAVQIADLTDDGLPDLVTANHFASSLTLLRATGSGFSTPKLLSVGENPDDVEVCDFDLDGTLDLAALNLNSDDLSILLGLGQGSFLPATSFEATNASQDMVAADVDADGVPDLAVAGYGQLVYLHGFGDGAFRAPVELADFGYSFNWPDSVKAGDVGGDGLVDLVTANGDGTCSLLEGHWPGPPGLPVMTAQQDFAAQGRSQDVALGDVDGNRTLDILLGTGNPSTLLPSKLFLLTAQCPATWQDLGQGLAGQLGLPSLSGTGILEPGDPTHLALAAAAPSSAGILVAGTSAVDLPFKGGTLVPQAQWLLTLGTDAAGSFSAAFAWPPGVPADTAFWLQAWIHDATAPADFSASNALKASPP